MTNTNGVALNEIKGVLVEKANRPCYGNGDEAFARYETHNSIIDQQGNVRISLKREKLVKVIQKAKANYLMFIREEISSAIIPKENDFIADAIIKKQKDLFEVSK